MPYARMLWNNLLFSKYVYFNLNPYLLWAFGAPIGWAFSTEIIALAGLVVIFIYVMLTRKFWGEKEYTSLIFNMVVMVFGFMIYSLITTELYWHAYGYGLSGPYYGVAHFVSSPLLAFFKLLQLILILAALIIYKPFFLSKAAKWEYGPLIIIVALSVLVLISTIDLIIGWVAIEVQTLTLYVMLSFKRYSNLSMEAAQKFFFFAAFGSCCLVGGIAILYGLTGETNIVKLGVFFSSMPQEDISYMAILGAVLITVGCLFKLALVPFHFWVGDVYQGTFGYFNSFLALISKAPMFMYFAKIYCWLLIFITPAIAGLLQIVALLSIIMGAVYAFTELNFKRFWALSAISSLGFVVLALSYGTCTSFSVAVLYMILYQVNTLFMWVLAIHLVKNPSASFAFNEFLTKLIKWTSLSKSRLALAVFVSVVLFSLAGLPPGAGFLPKAWFLLHLYTMKDIFLFVMVFLASFVSMAYYIRIARFILFPINNGRELESFKPLSPVLTYMLLFVFTFNLLVMVFFFGLSSLLLQHSFLFLTVVA